MDEEVDWSLTTFEGARRAQRRESAKLTLREKIIAVEEMVELARRLQGQRTHSGPSPEVAPAPEGKKSE
ncbi:MAG TPA: hypothetical protein VD997_14995 [Phycisphaerales bacterium]|nr:hypothetical protein [Phycisphaerales bacterium]